MSDDIHWTRMRRSHPNMVTRTIGTSAEVIAPYSSRRVAIHLIAQDTAAIWIGIGRAPADDDGLRILGGSRELLLSETLWGGASHGPIYAICPAGGGVLTIVEMITDQD